MASDSERVASTVPTSEDLILQAQVPVSKPSEVRLLIGQLLLDHTWTRRQNIV